MNKFRAIQKFFSSFAIPAFEENSVRALTAEEMPEFPYLTYTAQLGTFEDDGAEQPCIVNLWYRGTSWADAYAKADELSQAIGMGGTTLKLPDGGLIWIKRGSPWQINMLDDNDDLIKRVMLNVSIEFETIN